MGKNTSGKQGGQRSTVSRKVLRSTAAAYERKSDGEGKGGEDGKDEKATKEGAPVESAGAKEAPETSKDDKKAVKDRGPGGAGKADAGGSPRGEADAARADAKPAAKPDGDSGGKEAPAPAAGTDKGAEAKGKEAGAAAAGDETPAAPPASGGEAPAAPVVEAETEYAELIPPRFIDPGDPGAPAPPPGKAPPGDSRSFRRYRDGAQEFVLVYRHGPFLITRAGKVGLQGTWTVVEYPTVGMAAHAYAQEGSRLTAEGYRDLR